MSLRFLVFIGVIACSSIADAQAQAPTVSYDRQIPMVMDASGDVFVTPLTATAATPVAAFGDTADLASSDQKAYVQQNVILTNLSDTYVCLKITTAAGNCTLLTMTCNASGTANGQPVPPGAQRAFRLNGTQKACVLAAGAALTKNFIVERTLRKPL